jgi:Methyltransferase domain
LKALIKRIFAIFKIPIDLLVLVFAAPAGLILLFYRRVGSAKLPFTTWTLKKIGVFPIRKHYYEPMFDDSPLTRPLSDDRFLPGIDFNVPGQLDFMGKLIYSDELVKMKWDTKLSDPLAFYIHNRSYVSGDAEFLYQFLRATKPRKIIEVGCGHSTKIAALARQSNSSETGSASTHICIEPYEVPWLEKINGIKVIRSRVEDCALDWGKELTSGDLLFIDSSHMIRPQGDVLKEFLEILPQLASGVYIHIHDIFTPKDYLDSWIRDEIRFWNEQYLLEALLSDSNRYEVIGALNYLMHHHQDELMRICPYLTPEREPGSFYMRVR